MKIVFQIGLEPERSYYATDKVNPFKNYSISFQIISQIE